MGLKMKIYNFANFPLYFPFYPYVHESRAIFSPDSLIDLSWVTNHFSDITDTSVNCLHLDLDFKDMWPNLVDITKVFLKV